MEQINIRNVTLKPGYWYSKQNLNRDVTIGAVYDRFYETKRMEAMDCIKDEPKDWQPHIFWDSDVAKWVEGASYVIAKNPNPSLENKIEEIIDKIEKNMWEDGYFNSYYTVMDPQNRFTRVNDHELYCLGHLTEAAIAYHNATGKDRFLKLIMRYIDLVYKLFYEEKSTPFLVPGHEEIELALYKLYRHTGNQKYLDLSLYFVETRGKSGKAELIYPDGLLAWSQAHTDIYHQHTAEGHSVRAEYFYSAVADLAYETKNERLKEIVKELFYDITEKKMYVTGATGQVYNYEGFAGAYYLPNESAYAETCAGISLIYFADRMLKLEENAKYADVIERVFYNNVLSGISLDGDAFFYENPLEINLRNRRINEEHKLKRPYSITQRVKVFSCSCCPPNLNRFLASLEQYIYYRSDETFYINQFASSELIDNDVKITIETNYPLDGKVTIKAQNAKRVAVRIPSWCDSYQSENGYLYFENPDEIELDFQMKPKFIYANENVYENIGRCCLSYGPVIYCAEGIDNETELDKLFVDSAGNIDCSYQKEFGLNILAADAYKLKTSDQLYSNNRPEFEKTILKMIPYSCFANRGETAMKVWFFYR